MNKSVLPFVFVLIVMLASAMLPTTVMAAPSMTMIPALQQPSQAMPIAEQLGAQLQSLVATPSPTSEEGDEANQEPPPTFGTRALNVVIKVTEILRNEAEHFVTDFSALPQLSDWVTQQTSDPKLVARWQVIGSDLVSSAGIALVIAVLMEAALYAVRAALRRRSPRNLYTRLAIVFSLFFVRAIPIMVFVAVSVLLLNQNDTQKLSRFLIMNMVYALALARAMIYFLRGVLSPKVEALRFVPATTAQAVYGFRWLRAFGVLIIFGYFFVGVARAVHVPETALTAFINLLGLILVVMGVVVIVQKRAFVAHLLRGNLSAAQHDLSWLEALRLWFARHWHRLAIAYLVIGYIIAATGVQDGLVLMLRGTLLTLSLLVAARLLFREIVMWEAHSAKKGTTTFYTLIKGGSLRLLITGIVVAGVLAAWGVDLYAVAASPLGHRLLGSAFSIGTTLVVLGLIYEFFSAAVDRHLTPSSHDNRTVTVNARSRTLLPMLRNTIFVVFLSILAVVVLSEAGINIAPLLAGAGVLGVAVGFGSQTLVKDFLTGLFIVLENTIAVGDFIKIGDHSGTVEAMSMRTLRLRDMDGNLHILPFSEVSKIINQTKGFSYALFRVNVASDTNLDRANDAIRAVGADMQNDPAYKYSILAPVEALGVDSINSDASITLIARIKTDPGKQWEIRRMFLMRLKQRFDKDGIRLPTTTIRLEKDD